MKEKEKFRLITPGFLLGILVAMLIVWLTSCEKYEGDPSPVVQELNCEHDIGWDYQTHLETIVFIDDYPTDQWKADGMGVEWVKPCITQGNTTYMMHDKHYTYYVRDPDTREWHYRGEGFVSDYNVLK